MRILLLGLLACMLSVTGGTARERAREPARERTREPGNRDREWVARVVTRISETERADAAAAGGGTVDVRIRINADGGLAAAAVEQSSGSVLVDERALRAVQSAAPFAPPPQRLLSLEGYTELGFPLQIEARPALKPSDDPAPRVTPDRAPTDG